MAYKTSKKCIVKEKTKRFTKTQFTEIESTKKDI